MLTIGQLARIFEISTKTLRHYDAIGLFVPARTGSDNGYRYYQPEQIEQLSRILALRRLDVPLEAIDRLKRDGALDDPQRLRHFLQRHQHTLREEISARQRLLAELDRTLATLAHWRIRNMHARIVERPAFSVVGMEYFGSAPATPSASSGNASSARARDRRQARSRGLLWHLRAAAQRRIPLCRRLRGAGGLAGAGGHGALPGAGAEVRGVHPGHGAADRRELPGDLQPPARRTRPGAQGGVDFEYYDQRFRGPLDPNSQVDLYIPIY